MMKRKYGSRFDWKRVLDRRYAELYVEEDLFKGYITLLHIVKVTTPLYVKYGTASVCIVNEGYYWMQFFPENEHYSLTTMFDSEGRIVQWYIDTCKGIGYSSEKGPWMDDLILDIVVLPSGQFIELDVEEFTLAQTKNLHSEKDVEVAWNEFNQLKEEIYENRFALIFETDRHFKMLKKKLTCSLEY